MTFDDHQRRLFSEVGLELNSENIKDFSKLMNNAIIYIYIRWKGVSIHSLIDILV